MEFVCVCQKIRKKQYFYWEFAKVCVGNIQYGGIDTFWNKNCVWIFLSDFFNQNVSKYLKQFSKKTWYSSKYL